MISHEIYLCIIVAQVQKAMASCFMAYPRSYVQTYASKCQVIDHFRIKFLYFLAWDLTLRHLVIFVYLDCFHQAFLRCYGYWMYTLLVS